ncbi:unnamed protein product [Auanema sp. JU1783]|nr:unnamed protein product [Auanema sp. JU1783]
MNGEKLRFAVSCSSNMNRSMEAHSFLQKRGFQVDSYGSGTQVKLPGPSVDKPNCYEFGSTTYDFIHNDLKTKDQAFYLQNGLLNMLDRNRRIKECPQKFQKETKEFDVIICLEERVYDQVVEHLHSRPQTSLNPVHVINIDIEDNPEEATVGAWFVCDICAKLEKCSDLDNEIDEILTEFEAENQKRNILHTICFY